MYIPTQRHPKKCSIPTLVFIGITALSLSSCTTVDLPPLTSGEAKDQSIEQQARHLDAAQKLLELYGTVTVSAPIFVDPGNDTFSFDLNRNSSEYFNESKSQVQGGVATNEQIVQNFALSIAASQDPTAAKKYEELLRQYDRSEYRRKDREDAADTAARDISMVAREEYLAATKSALQETDLTKRAQMISDANESYAKAISLTDLTAEPPSIPSSETVNTQLPTNGEPKTGTAQNTFSSENGKFKAPFALLEGISGNSSDRTISNRSAIITAAGDKTVQSIFNVLGNPERNNSITNRKVFFGVAMVSVIPGTRTQYNFAADVSVQVDLELHRALSSRVADFINENTANLDQDFLAGLATDAGVSPTQITDALTKKTVMTLYEDIAKQPPPTRSLMKIPAEFRGENLSDSRKFKPVEADYAVNQDFAPSVSAVAPMTESQILDLASSYRKQHEFALSIAYALQSAGQTAQASSFLDYAKQLETDAVTRSPQNLVTGYSRGNIFGYQVGPSFQALKNPSNDTKPSDVLQRQSFPVLVIFSMEKSLSKPLIYLESDAKNNMRYVLMEPYITLTQQDSWTPTTRFKSLFSRETVLDRARAAGALKEIQTMDDDDTLCKKNNSCEAAVKYLKAKARQLDNLLNTPKLALSLPTSPPKTLQISSIFPETIPSLEKDSSTQILVRGKLLKEIKDYKLSVLPTDLSDSMQVTFEPSNIANDSMIVSIKALKPVDNRTVVLQFQADPLTHMRTSDLRLLCPPLTIKGKVAAKPGGSTSEQEAAKTPSKALTESVKMTTHVLTDGEERTISIAKDATSETIKAAVDALKADSEKKKPVYIFPTTNPQTPPPSQ